MCEQHEFTFPITGERLERLKARNPDESPAHPDEWAQLIRQESPKLLWAIKGHLRCRRDVATVADDALQATWLTLLKKVGPNYDRPTLERSYLFHCALGASTHIRRSPSHAQGHGESDLESDFVQQLETRSIASGEGINESFEGILDRAEPKLTEREREIVRLHLIEGLTFAEIAKALHEPLGTVYGTYRRALERVQTGLGDDPFELT